MELKITTLMKNIKFIFIALCCFPFLIQAQDATKPEFEIEKLEPYTARSQFGIMLELNNSNTSNILNDFSSVGFADELNNVREENGLGIALGLIYGYELNDKLTFRTQAMLSFLETSYIYDFKSQRDKIAKRESVNIEIPVHLVLEDVTKKISPSAVLGARYRFDISQNTLTSQLAGNYKGYDVLLDAGLGLGFKFDNFRFKTELLYSKGMINQVVSSESLAVENAIKSSFTNQLSLRFMFYM